MTRLVTAALRAQVFDRDKGCVPALHLGHVHQCRDLWGTPHAPDRMDVMTLDHVQEGYGRCGVRAPSSLRTLVTVCAELHLRTHWVTSHKPLLREYLSRANKEAA